MGSSPGRWRLLVAGLVAGLAGLAVSYALVGFLGVRAGPIIAVAEVIIVITPGAVAESLIQLVGQYDKPLLVTGVFLMTVALTALAGLLIRAHRAVAYAILAVLTVVGIGAVSTDPDAGVMDSVPVLAGAITWFLLLPMLARAAIAVPGPGDRVHDAGPESKASGSPRRRFLALVGGVGAGAVVVAVLGEVALRSRQAVEASRRLLRLPVSNGQVPSGASTDLAGMPPWRTPNPVFYRIDTALVVPAVETKDWRLRIHGLVERELEITYDDLLERRLTESWVTLCCVSNRVGGELVGNAWWSGVPVADVLADAGVLPEADAVLQTSVDGWNCATPPAALAQPNALLAVAMNGEPLPLEHGFPVRMVVPGLYGYVSATKWLVDLELTRFDQVSAYWTERGWSEKGPIKTQSRIDVPRRGSDVPAGVLGVGGTAWAQDTGVAYVEYRLDNGPWREAALGRVPNEDTWVQWKGEVTVAPGRHLLTVRATDRSGYTQTRVEQGVLPNGATGYHSLAFVAT